MFYFIFYIDRHQSIDFAAEKNVFYDCLLAATHKYGLEVAKDGKGL